MVVGSWYGLLRNPLGGRLRGLRSIKETLNQKPITKSGAQRNVLITYNQQPLKTEFQMPATILTSQHYDAVRGLIAPDVTAVHISDDYLSQQPFAPDAERQVRKRLSAEGIDVDALTGDAAEDALLAMMHQCASELCLTAPQMIRQTQLQVVTEVQSIDWKEKRAFHLTKVEEKVADIVESVAKSGGASKTGTRRKLPFGAVGTQRQEIGEPRRPYRRVVHTYND